MGEYATYRGGEIKIGTCENLYYLRYDQRALVQPLPGNVDPSVDAAAVRFRFPWPDEDHIEPGAFEAFERSIAVPNYPAQIDTGVDHGSIQFHAPAGYLISLPCPEASAALVLNVNGKPTTIHRNGFSGAVHLVQQKYRPALDRLVPVLKCGGCGAKWRVEQESDIEEIAMLFRAEADRRSGSAKDFYHRIADRVLFGLAAPALRAVRS